MAFSGAGRNLAAAARARKAARGLPRLSRVWFWWRGRRTGSGDLLMIVLYAFALVAGVANAFQAGTNSTLSKALGAPFLAALLVVGVSALALAAAGLASGRLAWPGAAAFGQVPWWGWVGGVLSAVLLMSQLVVADAIGAGPFLGIIVVAGTVTSLVIDNYGWVGFKVHELNPGRIVGGAMMSLGVLLVALF